MNCQKSESRCETTEIRNQYRGWGAGITTRALVHNDLWCCYLEVSCEDLLKIAQDNADLLRVAQAKVADVASVDALADALVNASTIAGDDGPGGCGKDPSQASFSRVLTIERRGEKKQTHPSSFHATNVPEPLLNAPFFSPRRGTWARRSCR